jgi:hypothetical protein
MKMERVDELIARLKEIEKELEEEFSKEGERLECDFSMEKISLLEYIAGAKMVHLLSAPVIYSMILPALLLDLFVSVYQCICFPLYGIPSVNRREYIVIDRHRLPYLNILQKINCVYCAYFNGLISYTKEISSRTEQYWCPIRHARHPKGVSERYLKFIPYGDAENLSRRWQRLRDMLSSKR